MCKDTEFRSDQQIAFLHVPKFGVLNSVLCSQGRCCPLQPSARVFPICFADSWAQRKLRSFVKKQAWG